MKEKDIFKGWDEVHGWDDNPEPFTATITIHFPTCAVEYYASYEAVLPDEN